MAVFGPGRVASFLRQSAFAWRLRVDFTDLSGLGSLRWSNICGRIPTRSAARTPLRCFVALSQWRFEALTFATFVLMVVPFCPFLGDEPPTRIDYRKKGTLLLTSLLEDLCYPTVPAVFGV